MFRQAFNRSFHSNETRHRLNQLQTPLRRKVNVNGIRENKSMRDWAVVGCSTTDLRTTRQWDLDAVFAKRIKTDSVSDPIDSHFSVTETTFFRELKRKRNLFERAEKNTQETTNIWLENRPKLRLNRKKTLDLSLSLSFFLSLSTSGPLCLPLSLSISGNYFDCKRKGKILTDIFKDDDVDNNSTNNGNNRWTIQNKFR